MPRRWQPLRLVSGAVVALGLVFGPVSTSTYAEPTAGAHVVQPGDTLSQIALDLGVDADALARLNGLDDANLLVAGQSLQVPTRGPAATPGPGSTAAPRAATASGATYTIADGDTLWSIAQRFATTTAALVEANNLDDGDRLKSGSRLVLPAGATGPSDPARNPAAAPAATSAPPAASAAADTPTRAPAPAPTPAAPRADARPTTAPVAKPAPKRSLLVS